MSTPAAKTARPIRSIHAYMCIDSQHNIQSIAYKSTVKHEHSQDSRQRHSVWRNAVGEQHMHSADDLLTPSLTLFLDLTLTTVGLAFDLTGVTSLRFSALAITCK